MSTSGQNAESMLVDISEWIDEALANAARDREAATWGRLAKIQEEAGEVISAYISYTGQNPRKQRDVNALIDVAKELLDVALTALAAYEHLTGHQGMAIGDLFNHIQSVYQRAVVPKEAPKTVTLPDVSAVHG